MPMLLRKRRRMIKAAMMKRILWVAIPVSLLTIAVSLFVLLGFPGTPDGDSTPPDTVVASEAQDKNAPRKAAKANSRSRDQESL